MKKILLIPKSQYGYNTDYYKMASYLSKQNIQVDILCFDNNLPKIEPPKNVNVIYVKRKKNKIFNYVQYSIEAIKYILKRRKKYSWILISGTIEYCGKIPMLLKRLTPQTKWIMDIRTCAVFTSEKKRDFYDNAMKWSVKFFDHITIISDLLANRLKINKYTLLPLGAERMVNIEEKKFEKNKIKFLYVGTFENRNIENLIKAYDEFCSKDSTDIQTSLDIVGFAHTRIHQERVEEAIKNANFKDRIIYHGRKNHDEIIGLFSEATIGFSYIPITDYYDVQPPTKTYEYIINGMICIGTNTKANTQIITEENGILVNEDIDSVVKGIQKIVHDLSKYSPISVSKTVEEYEWDKIEERFYKYLKKINEKNY
ncbi:glycosyltransferase [Bacillus cereus]|uniref:Glycosyltransferase n=1 Tax=Bacillus cereus TaxID=1396 RepID=A0ABD4L8R3_BACCE|nr:glycosyltransferase [Bacillus cereus]MBK1606526.1 glycosyltransferase [Bacillus cereus]MBR9697712.1 hypothetical protein [Bacillus cereus]HDR8097193.1 glycosyltransferase [Bacillus cereus]HDX9663017.1 glycosyltransferase [Bacillus cereus]